MPFDFGVMFAIIISPKIYLSEGLLNFIMEKRLWLEKHHDHANTRRNYHIKYEDGANFCNLYDKRSVDMKINFSMDYLVIICNAITNNIKAPK